MITCVIIDDEENNILNLTILLQKNCSHVRILATAIKADEGINMITQYKPDVVFLDIQMPGKNGFQMLQSLPKPDFEIIFVTAYDQYGIQAIKWSALDYLLKPVRAEDLQKAIQKAEEKRQTKKQNLHLQNLLDLLQHNLKPEERRIALSSAKETRFVETEHIIRCESQNSYTLFYLDDNEKILVSKPIYEYEEMLADYGFIRCHQSHLVNTRWIKSWLKKDGDSLLLKNGTEVPVSRQKKDWVKQKLL